MNRREALLNVMIKTAGDEDNVRRALRQAQINRLGYIYNSERHKALMPNLRVVEIEMQKQGLSPLFMFFDGRFLCYDHRKKGFVIYNTETRKRGEFSPNVYQLLQLEKRASVTGKELARSTSRVNRAEGEGVFKSMISNKPDNFLRGVSNYTRLGVNSRDPRDISYQTTTTGVGRKNQSLTAERFYGDLLHGQPNPENRIANAERLNRERQQVGARGNLANLLAAGVGAGAGILANNNPESNIATGIAGGLGGAFIGAGANLAVRHFGNRRAEEEYYNRLNDIERSILNKVKNTAADEVSQKASLSDRLVGQNVYVF